MQAVIVAAGKGTRMRELGEKTPKPMLTVLGKNLIEYKIEALPPEVEEVIIVVGHLGDQIVNYFGDEYGGRKITYVWQKELLGTCDALWQAKDLLHGTFIVMMGDDIYSKDEIEKCLSNGWAILVRKVNGKAKGGRVHVGEDMSILDIVEGEHEAPELYVNAALYVLKKDIFNYEPVKIPGREEWGLPQTIVSAIRDGHKVTVVESNFWIQITSPEDLIKAEALLQKQSIVV